jgi:hypothetical protein
MSRWLATILLLSFACPAFATTQIIFSKDGSKATITLLAFTVNPDASLLFKTMSQAPKDEMGKLTKRIDFVNAEGMKSLDFSCVFSKLAPDTGSCILVLHATSDLAMDPANSRVRYQLSGPEAESLASAFVAPLSGDEIYQSSDGLMAIRAKRNADGSVESFVLTYGR